MHYQAILDQIYTEIYPTLPQGKVADYIPQLATIDPGKFGMALISTEGEYAFVGDANERFSIQSISKVITLTMAMQLDTQHLWQRVNREPSGTAFNSLVQLEFEEGIPRNPFINAGALVVTDLVLSNLGNINQAVLDFVHKLSGQEDIEYDMAVAASEAATGYRNSAMAHFLKSFDNLDNHPEAVLDAYYHHCALSMSCVEIAQTFNFLAQLGNHHSGRIIEPYHAKYINSLMLTCGTYDSVGDFAYRVGLPGKSGVGGGILATLPGAYSVCVWSPGLDEHGNSLAGTLALERFTQLTDKTIF